MDKHRYIIVDNRNFLGYFMENLQGRYTPVVTEYHLYSYFKLRGIRAVGIYDYLREGEIKDFTLNANAFVSHFLNSLDKANEKTYEKLFGLREVKLFSEVIGVFPKRFMTNSFLFLRGVIEIVEKEGVKQLYYLHDGEERFLCFSESQKSFFFPDDITWKILQAWQGAKGVAVTLLKAPQRDPSSEDRQRIRILYLLKKVIFRNLRSIIYAKRNFRCYMADCLNHFPHKKNILILSPWYDLFSVLHSLKIRQECNVIQWDIDKSFLPHMRRYQKKYLREMVLQGGSDADDVREALESFEFKIEDTYCNNPLDSFDFTSFIIPLIKEYLKEKLLEIVTYWRLTKALHELIGINMLLWGNPPVRHSGGIIKEFCRIQKIAIVGMQHGGRYGSNETIDYNFDSDYSKCDYYLSYGFTADDIKKYMLDGKQYPEIIPVGSTNIATLRQRIQKGSKKKGVILYPLAINDPFFLSLSLITPESLLGDFQRKIIDLLCKYTTKRVIISCLYEVAGVVSSIQPYLEKVVLSFPHIEFSKKSFFGKLLQGYKPDIILVDESSTALNEALMTDSEIIVYNDSVFDPLTDNAYRLLSKRAIVCNTQREFLEALNSGLNGKVFGTDKGDKEFVEKYCVYKGNPRQNIERAISKICSRMNN